MSEESGQAFIDRNRPPRVQIVYTDETYGSPKRTELPFVVGVMADLAGKRPDKDPLPSVKEREFLEIDSKSFDAHMSALHPRVAFTVPSVRPSEEDLKVEMTFASMDDFTPGAVARKVPQLRRLLEARERLSRLLTSMDGKDAAEALVNEILDKAQRGALAEQPKPADAGG